ncbi:MAG: RNA methyltransferase [Bacteroidales bacterium]
MRKLKNSELNRLSVEEFKHTEKFPVVVVLDNVRSLNNVGSVFRSSDGFLVERICLCGITAKPPHRDIHKTALGATNSVHWEYFDTTEKAVNKFREEGYLICAVEQADKSIYLTEFVPEKKNKYALIFGHEVRGVQQSIVEMSDMCLEIPQSGTKHSFNISVSAGIVLYHFYYHFKTK